jgi:hypothetical protein
VYLDITMAGNCRAPFCRGLGGVRLERRGPKTIPDAWRIGVSAGGSTPAS